MPCCSRQAARSIRVRAAAYVYRAIGELHQHAAYEDLRDHYYRRDRAEQSNGDGAHQRHDKEINGAHDESVPAPAEDWNES